MKLWILSDIWQKLQCYWERFVVPSIFHKNDKDATQCTLAGIVKDQNRAKNMEWQKSGRVYKFIAEEFSDSLQLSFPPLFKKNKQISKKNKQNKRYNRKDSVDQSQDVKHFSKMMIDMQSQISSIGMKESQESNTTIKQFLYFLGEEPKKLAKNSNRYEIRQPYIFEKYNAKQSRLKKIKVNSSVENKSILLGKKKISQHQVPFHQASKDQLRMQKIRSMNQKRCKKF